MTDSRETVRRFQSTAEHYVRYRPRYPQGLIDAVADTRHLDGRGRLLDLGTGPGFLALALATRFEATVAMDPESEMLAVAEAEARATGIVLTLVLGGSEDLGPHLGRFRLVNRTGADDDQHSNILAEQDVLNNRPRAGDVRGHRFSHGQFLAQLEWRRKRLLERDVNVGNWVWHWLQSSRLSVVKSDQL